MSTDIYITYTEADLLATGDIDLIRFADTNGDGRYTVYSTDFTYNYTPALVAAGLINGWATLLAVELTEARVALLKFIIAKLQVNPSYGDLIKGGGSWGTLPELIAQLEELTLALQTHPKGNLVIS